MESVHGHDVMNMMLENEQGWTRASLQQAIVEKYGESCRFHTCSAKDMDAGQLINFLEQKGKFVDAAEGFNTEASKICNH